MDQKTIDYFNDNPFVEKMNSENILHYNWLYEFFSVFNNESLMETLDAMFEKTDKVSNDKNLLVKYSNLLNNIVKENLTEIKIICLCGSHIDDPNRIPKLHNMLKSWVNQR